jgi:hypothetical protein
MQRAPVNAGATHPFAGEEGAEAADRQRQFIGRVAESNCVDRIVLHQFEAHHIAQLVTQPRQREFVGWLAVSPALKADDIQSGLGKLAGHDRAGPAHAHHDRIGFLQTRCHG